MRNENIAVIPTVETEPLTRRRFMGVAAMLAPGLCATGPEGTALPDGITKQAKQGVPAGTRENCPRRKSTGGSVG